MLSILAFTIVSLAIFVSQGKVLWLPGLVLALGTFLGGQLGVRFTVLKGHAWVKRVVTVTIIVFAVKLWVDGAFPAVSKRPASQHNSTEGFA